MFSLHLEKYNWSMLLYFEEISNELVVRKQRNIYLADHSHFFCVYFLLLSHNYQQFYTIYCRLLPFCLCLHTGVLSCRKTKQNI